MVVLKAYQQPAVKAYNYLIDPGSLDSSRADIMGTFGTKSDSLRILYFKPEAKLLNINELLTHFHISSKYFDLPIYIDSNIVYHKETSRFQVKTVTSVKIQKEKNTGTKYIMIKSIYHVNNPIADVYIFGVSLNQKKNNLFTCFS